MDDELDSLYAESLALTQQAVDAQLDVYWESANKLYDLVKAKFTSGNDIPVDRITITARELEALGIKP